MFHVPPKLIAVRILPPSVCMHKFYVQAHVFTCRYACLPLRPTSSAHWIPYPACERSHELTLIWHARVRHPAPAAAAHGSAAAAHPRRRWSAGCAASTSSAGASWPRGCRTAGMRQPRCRRSARHSARLKRKCAVTRLALAVLSGLAGSFAYTQTTRRPAYVPILCTQQCCLGQQGWSTAAAK